MSRSCWGIVVGLAALTLSACEDNNLQRLTIGRDTFEVPSERLLSSDVVFLPSSQNDALRFMLNPEDAQADQISVSLQDADVICHLSGANSPNYRGGACSGDDQQFSRTPLRRADVEHSGGTLWEYSNSDGVRVVTCSELGNGAGSCTADGRFSNTVFSIQFQDSRIDDLPVFVSEVVETLAGWHVPRES